MPMNAASRARLLLLYPEFAVRCRRAHMDFEDLHGISLECSEGIRTFATQQARYDQGRTIPGKVVTNSKPGFSGHHYGIASDWKFPGKDPYLEELQKTDRKRADFLWEEFARIAEGYGLTSGRHWRTLVDSPHVELFYGGMKVQEVFELYRRGGMIAVWAEFDRIRGVPVGQDWYGPQPTIVAEFNRKSWENFRTGDTIIT